jgi:urocanate hydratase
MPKRCRSLQSIIEKKFKSKVSVKGSKARKMWMKITKRVLDPEAIEELVQEGALDVDEISPAWYETKRAPYLRVYEDE